MNTQTFAYYLFKRQPHKMVKHTLSVFDHFVGLALKGLITIPGRG